MPDVIRVRKGSATVVCYVSPDVNGYYTPEDLDRNSVRYLGDSYWVELQPNGFELHYEAPAVEGWTVPNVGMGLVNNLQGYGFAVPFMGSPIRLADDANPSAQSPLCQIDAEWQYGYTSPPEGVYGTTDDRAPGFAIAGSANSMDLTFHRASEVTAVFNLPASAVTRNCGIAGMTCGFNFGNGNLVLSLSLPNAGPADPPLWFYYNSQFESQTEFGYGWSSLWGQWVEDLDTEDPPGICPLQRVVSPAGATWTMSRDDASLLTSIVDPASGATTFDYDAGLLTAVTDSAGRTTNFEMDTDGNLTRVLVAGQSEIQFQYDSNRALTAVQAADGAITTFSYDLLRRLEGITNAVGASTGVTYAGVTRVVTDPESGVWAIETDADGNTTRVVTPNAVTLGYGWLGTTQRLASRTNGAGAVTTFSYATMDDNSSRLTRYAQDYGYVQLDYDTATGDLTRIIDKAGWQSQLTWVSRQRTTYVDEIGATSIYEYDGQGGMTQAMQPSGNVWNWQYDTQARLTRATDPLLNSRIYEYDSRGQVSLVRDEEGYEARLNRDVLNRITETIDAGQSTRMMDYDAVGRMTQSVDPLGATQTFAFDAAGLVTEAVNPEGATVTWEYDAGGNRTLAVNERGLSTVWRYDAIGRLTEVASPLGVTESFAYDLADNCTLWIDGRGNSWQWAYDLSRRLTARVNPQLAQTGYFYDGNGRATTRVDEAGNESTYNYDRRGRLTQAVDELGYPIEYEYDSDGLQTKVIEPQNNTQVTGYDESGRATQVYSDGQVTALQYDARGDVTSIARPGGPTVQFQYNGWRLPAARVDANGGTVTWNYDSRSLLTETVNAAGGVELRGYDLVGRRTLAIDADNGTRNWSYDPTGNATLQSDSRPASGTFSYDDGNRRTREVWSDGVTLQLGFDAANNRTLSIDPRGTTTTAFDSRNLPVAATVPNKPGLTATMGYDARGLRTSLTAYDDGDFASRYDARGLQTRVVHPGGKTWTAHYDGLRRVTDIEYGAGARSTRAFSEIGLTAVDQYDADATLVNAIGVAYDALARRTAQSESDGADTYWEYDSAGNLAAERCTRATTAIYDVEYAYDVASRRTLAVDDVTTATMQYSAGGRLTQSVAGAQTTSYTYDAVGQRTTRITGTLTTIYNYDARGNLVDVQMPGGTVSYVVDVDGRVVSRTSVSSVETLLVYDGTRLLTETDDSFSTESLYVHIGESLVAHDNVASGLSDLLPDPWGHTGLVAEAGGATSGPYRHRSTGMHPDGTQAGGADNGGMPIGAVTPFGFFGSSGVCLDSELQLYRYDGALPGRTQWFDPFTAQYLKPRNSGVA